MKSPLTVDVETIGTPFDGRVVTLGWQVLGECAHVARFEDVPESVFDMITDPEQPFISHTKYDARFLRLCYEIPVTGPFYDTQVMARLLNENQSLALDALVLRYCKYKMDKRIRRKEGSVLFLCDDGSLVPLDEAPIDQLYAYNMRDVEAETELFETLYERLLDGEWLGIFLQEEVPYTEVLLDMECRGFPVDLKRTAIFAEEMEKEHVWLDGELHETGSLPVAFNLNSPDQLAAYLFAPKKVFELVADLDVGPWVCECVKSCLAGEHEDCAGIPELPSDEFAHVVDLLPDGFTIGTVGRTVIHGRYTLRSRGLKPGVKTETGKLAVSRPALKGNFSTASDPWCQRLLEYKQVDKLLTTYLRKFPKVAVEVGASRSDESLPELTGTPISTRIFGKFNQTGTKTGRLSSSEPNLQNIPTRTDLGARVRDLFRTVT